MPQTDGKKFGETAVSKNGTTTIPKAVRVAEDITPGDESVEWWSVNDEWVLRPTGGDAE